MLTAFLNTALLLLLWISPADGSAPKRTDALDDGLLGPVRSTSTRQELQQIEWPPEMGLSIVPIIPWPECEYDPEGNRVKMGQIVDAAWRGEVTQIRKGANDLVIERSFGNGDGSVYRRELYSPDGITDQFVIENGAVTWHSMWFYDGNGKPAGFKSYNKDGTLTGSTDFFTDAGGTTKEQWTYGANGEVTLHVLEIDDPDSKSWTLTSYAADGSIKVHFKTMGQNLVEYQQAPGEENPFGSGFTIDPEGKVLNGYTCHADSKCDRTTMFFDDETRHNVRRIERRNADGALLQSGEYEYELDSHGNWTKRTVLVWSAQLGEKKLFETDYRTIKYWGE